MPETIQKYLGFQKANIMGKTLLQKGFPHAPLSENSYMFADGPRSSERLTNPHTRSRSISKSFLRGVRGIGANLSAELRPQDAPSPYPLPPGERDLESPSLDGRGKGEGDKRLTSLVRHRLRFKYGSQLPLGGTDCSIKQPPSRLAPSVMTHKLGVFGVGSGEGLFAKSPSPGKHPALRTACGAKETIQNYLLVAKPGMVLGNLISAAAGFFLASKGRIDGAALAGTLIGISLVVASGCVFNNCIDRKIDRKMLRTRNRALAKGIISLNGAVSYATILGVAGMALLWAATNLLCVVITLVGFLIYVGVYSLYMKRNSVYSTLVGSLAGAAPPLAGYCAVTGRFDLGALLLFSIFTLWQMPHCYAIAVYRLDDYTAAGVPVLPVKQGTAVARRHIVGWILAFMVATLMLTFAGYTGYSTFAVAIVLGLSWLYMAWSGYKASEERLWARKLFIFSILTISILSVMMSLDFTAPVPPEMLLSCAP
jgi:heme o synthase